jgi:hypothetical protein
LLSRSGIETYFGDARVAKAAAFLIQINSPLPFDASFPRRAGRRLEFSIARERPQRACASGADDGAPDSGERFSQ